MTKRKMKKITAFEQIFQKYNSLWDLLAFKVFWDQQDFNFGEFYFTLEEAQISQKNKVAKPKIQKNILPNISWDQNYWAMS